MDNNPGIVYLLGMEVTTMTTTKKFEIWGSDDTLAGIEFAATEADALRKYPAGHTATEVAPPPPAPKQEGPRYCRCGEVIHPGGHPTLCHDCL